MRSKRNKVGGILIMAGTSVMGIAYTPVSKPKPTRDFIEHVYIRPTGEQRWYASEVRKRQILDKISAAKKVIRIKAESYQIDKNTRVIGITANQKLNIHSMKLMSRIADCKKCKI